MDNNGWRENMIEFIQKYKKDEPDFIPRFLFSVGFNQKQINIVMGLLKDELHTAIEEEQARFVEDLKKSWDTKLGEGSVYWYLTDLITKYSPSDKETTE